MSFDLHEEDLRNTLFHISLEFASNKNYEEVLFAICSRIAGFVRSFTMGFGNGADAWYLFPDHHLNEIKYFRIPGNPQYNSPRLYTVRLAWPSRWQCEWFRLAELDHPTVLAVIGAAFPNSDAAVAYLESQSREGRTLTLFSLSTFRKNAGYVLVPVGQHFNEHHTLCRLLHEIQQALFHYCVAFYQADDRTYLPSLFERRSKRVATLFTDLRNSSAVFQILRIAKESHLESYLAFLKAYLQFASDLVGVSGIGRIHSFQGDGFMATFGDHFISKASSEESHAQGVCAIALFAAERLVRGFDHLYDAWRDVAMKSFDLDYNEDVRLRLGIGITYGEVRFEEFGVSRTFDEEGRLRPGILAYTAVGDHVNLASRLVGIAARDVHDVQVFERSSGASERDPQRIAPIVVSKPVAIATAAWVANRAPHYTFVALKGMGYTLPVLELWPQPLELHTEFEEATINSKKVVQVLASTTNDDFAARRIDELARGEAARVRTHVDAFRRVLLDHKSST
jgi:class 3 adenylate cyclase